MDCTHTHTCPHLAPTRAHTRSHTCRVRGALLPLPGTGAPGRDRQGKPRQLRCRPCNTLQCPVRPIPWKGQRQLEHRVMESEHPLCLGRGHGTRCSSPAVLAPTQSPHAPVPSTRTPWPWAFPGRQVLGQLGSSWPRDAGLRGRWQRGAVDRVRSQDVPQEPAIVPRGRTMPGELPGHHGLLHSARPGEPPPLIHQASPKRDPPAPCCCLPRTCLFGELNGSCRFKV